MHYFKWRISDYASHTQHLDEMEDLAYRRMLDWYYLHESPLPESVEQIARLIRMRTHSESIANVLHEFFELSEYGYIQKAADKEINAYKAKSEKAKASAAARWSTKPNKSDANALRTECEGNANHKPLTNNQEPITKFSFKNELIGLGVEESIVDDWLTVRKKKRASNTETAFKGLINQIEKTSLSTNEAIKLCVENSWSGFKADYVKDETSNIPYEKIMELFNKHCPALKTCFDLTATRKRGIAEIWNADTRHQDGKFWIKYLSTINSSADITNQWENSADYAFNYKTFVKLMEATC